MCYPLFLVAGAARAPRRRNAPSPLGFPVRSRVTSNAQRVTARISSLIPRSELMYAGKAMLMAATVSPSPFRIGAATHMIPRVISSRSSAYPHRRTLPSSLSRAMGSVMV